MQIKFLNIYNYYDIEPCQVQYELLEFWQKAIAHDQVNFIHNAKVSFIEYTFEEYSEFDQEKLIREIHKSALPGYDVLTNSHYLYVAGKRYDRFEELYDDLSKTHRLMELVITVEEE